MSLYGRFFARAYDRMLAGTERAGLGAQREALLHGLSGRVLEIGGGTGANLAHYTGVDALVMTEPEEPMLRQLRSRIAEHEGLSVELVQASAESLPFAEDSFDVVVSTLVLCTVADPDRALAEIRRVLAPGGRLVFLEHVRADDPGLARWQDRLNGVQTRIGHGCNCNRPTVASIEHAGFAITDLRHDRLPKAPPIIRPLVVGTARVPG